MAMSDFLNKAKNMLSGHKDQAEQGIDKGAQLAKDKTPDQFDGKVDDAADKAKDALE
ncbi:MAG TPA: antitoxin [Mycobacteriales bacterium]|jgi:hypothetical protein|nr:antitoxin [Mycobacteriales bacterium]